MNSTKNYVACDLGAESGRVVVGRLVDDKVSLQECHRFPTGATHLQATLRWDLLRFFDQIQSGIRAAKAQVPQIDGFSIDAWGVDYAYFSDREPLLGTPFHYRDSRTDETFPAFVKKAGRELIFRETGVQFMQINTLYQLYDDALHRRRLVDLARHFLGIADYLHYLFSGEPVMERSLASTTQIFSPVTNDWSQPLINELGLPRQLFPPVVVSGTRIGQVALSLTAELGTFPIFATCSHDTGAAVAAVPAEGEHWAFLSSGTWSLLGVELLAPRLDADCMAANYTNELGHEGTVRFLRNILGLWILQETRREMIQQGSTVDYVDLVRAAEGAAPLRSLIDPNASEFLKPGQMIEKIQSFCRRTSQPIPDDAPSLARCILESLALSYATQLDQLSSLLDKKLEVLHVVGGGSQNRLLNQFTANASGLRVTAGPVEATALGNLLIQAIAAGELGSLAELRAVIRRSYTIDEFTPQETASWTEWKEKFSRITI
ncbi:MAG TPA: rhamnulokinase family protein [Chthoniobacterales bacterium]|nr:rhamnulokinase family protein [Chthoniobacterales bacterium]